MQRQPNITRAQEYLDDWAPQVALEEGLKKTIEYFDQLLTGSGDR
jgi:UDP-glucuronate decarboxylase